MVFPSEKTKVDRHTSSAYRRLVDEFGLDSSCGYVTFLKSGEKSKKGSKLKLEKRKAGAAAEAATTGDPKNGIVDSAAKDLLGEELRDLEAEMKEKESALGSSDAIDAGDVADGQLAGEDEEWNLLDCHFGIPLFDAQLNGDICARVISEKLFNGDNLEAMNGASRRLTLRLLQFIASAQDSIAKQEMTADVLTNPHWPANGSNQIQSTVTLPTQNLIFEKGALSVWDGR